MKLTAFDLDVTREPLVRPFSFKGGAFTEKWILVVGLRTDDGLCAKGVGSVAVLWSDPTVFFAHSETGGNLLMAAICEQGARMLMGQDVESPVQALKHIVEPLHDWARTWTGEAQLRRTFILNSLIALDNALWNLVAARDGISRFDDLMPPDADAFMTARQQRLVCLPAITYNTPMNDIEAMAQSGQLLPKIKIGQAGTQEEMLRKDIKRLQEIHAALDGAEATYSDDGKLLYTLDANGRYETKDTFQQLVDATAETGMLERILLIEEPFPEEMFIDVSDMPVPIAADECLHGAEDVRRRADLGYAIMTLKPAGKTLSMSIEMGREAARCGVHAIVADSACVPIILPWNMNVAARLPALPRMRCGILESNGRQNYRNWKQMVQRHPCSETSWLEPVKGEFRLDDTFFEGHGGVVGITGDYGDLVSV